MYDFYFLHSVYCVHISNISDKSFLQEPNPENATVLINFATISSGDNFLQVGELLATISKKWCDPEYKPWNISFLDFRYHMTF